MNLRFLPLLLLAPALAAAQQPNVVIVNIDDMGYADLATYGSAFSVTPNLDQLAAEGTKFNHFYAGAPICSPSRAGMFTGQFAARSGINSFLSAAGENLAKDSENHLALSQPSMARTFQEGGYATGHFGKWHLGGGRDIGYEVNPTPGTVATAPRIVEYGYDTAWTQFEGLANRIINVNDYGGDANGVTTRPSAYLNGLNSSSDARGTGGGLDEIVYLEREYNAEFMVDRAMEFIDATKTADPSQPFFMNVWLDEVHTPHDPPPAIVAKYNNDPQYANLPQRQRDYLAVLEATDAQIGRLVDHIDSQGLGGETLILVTADNGADPDNVALIGSSGPFRGSKGDVFEGGFREPLIARWTGNVTAGRTDTQTVMAMTDLFPTLTSIANVANPAGVTFDGEDLSGAILGTSQTRTNSLFWNTNRGIENRHSSPVPGAAGEGGQEVVALRSGDWKLIANATGTAPELYDLANDPGETTNLASQQPALAKQLVEEALAIRYETPARILPGTVTPIVRLKAEDLTGSLSDGASVQQWNDSATGDSVNGTVQQGSLGERPTLQTGVLNGRAVVEFDGTNDVLLSSTNNSLPNPAAGLTVFAVASSDPSGADAERLAQFGDNTGAAGETAGFDLSSSTPAANNGGAGLRFNNGASLYDTPISGGGFHIVAWQLEDGGAYSDATMFVNGTEAANTFTGNSNNLTGTLGFSGNDLELLLGTGRNGALLPDDHYGGQLAEFLIFNDQLSIGQMNLVGNYLSSEYDLPFAYNTAGIVLFDVEGLAWVGGAADFGAGWNRGDGAGGSATSNSNPFGNSGGEDLYLGGGGVATYSATTDTSAGTSVNSLRIGTTAAGFIVNGAEGLGTLYATDNVSLTIGNGSPPIGDAPTGDLTLGRDGQTGTLNWDSGGTLKVEGKLRVGQGGVGVLNQNGGTVTAGDVGGPLKFAAIGDGLGSTGVYNLNDGALLPGGGIVGSVELRHLRVGFAGGVGQLNVGDGAGGAGSARLESRDDLYIGFEGAGVMRVEDDGRVHLVGIQAPVYVGFNVGGNGVVHQQGGVVTNDSDFSIGQNAGATGLYVLSGGQLNTATDGSGEFRIGSTGGSGTLRVEGTGEFDHGHALFVGHQGGTAATGRLEIAGSTASITTAKLENAPGSAGPGQGVDESIRWEADAFGVTPIVVTGTAGNNQFVQIQDPAEVIANSGGPGSMMGDGIALELDLSALAASTTLTLIDNRTNEAVVGMFELGSTGDLFEQGETIAGTGFHGTVTLSYTGGTGNDVTLNLVAAPGLAGDYNNDGEVNAADYTVWRNTLGSTTNLAANGEMNGASAGVIDAADYLVWRNNYGATLGSGSSQGVPEPTTIALAALAVAAAPLRRF